jgi:CRISPR-associated exonuclease Cas4
MTSEDDTATTWADDEDARVMISALEHYAYCARQCALIHVEQIFDENLYTLKGRLAHQRADEPTTRTEGQVRVERGLPLWSLRLGLTGKADVVEFHGTDGATPYPVEYKVGRRRAWPYEALQVCAQGICLEEMLGRSVPGGAIYYVGSRARREVEFTATLRVAVEEMTEGVRAMLSSERMPEAPNDQRCAKCSLIESCLPAVVVSPRRVRAQHAELWVPLPVDATDERGNKGEA